MSTDKKPLASWAYSLVVAVIAAGIAVVFFAIAPDGAIVGIATLVAVAGLVIGVIQYLLTKRQA